MNMILLGEILDIVGKSLIAYTAISVHYRVWKEHKISDKVFKIMRREQAYGIVGIALMVIGFFLRLPSII